ncbi:hypothetical protein H8D57_03715 [bacterium]|nr:hypothetical protein [bacterium]
MSNNSIHFIWHIHQPFFIPEDELNWRISSSYIPLIDALSERNIACSINITGDTLRRIAALSPPFINLLKDYLNKTTSIMLGSAACHPSLPWLSRSSAKAQVRFDREVKELLGFPFCDVFWPTELAWSMRVGHLARVEGYRAVIIDSESRDALNQIPMWKASSSGLEPITHNYRQMGSYSKIITTIPIKGKEESICLWVREHQLSDALIKLMIGEEESSKSHLDHFINEISKCSLKAFDPQSPLIVANDVERFLPNSLSRFLDLLDGLCESNVCLCSYNDLDDSSKFIETEYVPASTMEGNDSMWTSTLDDRLCNIHLTQITQEIESLFDVLYPIGSEQKIIRQKLIEVQDSSLYFWHYITRVRAAFFAEIIHLENLVEKYREINASKD